MNRKKEYPVFNIGTVSILTIFVILCLVTFSVLSLISARDDMQYSQKIADRTTAYYMACKEANQYIEEIDEFLVAHSDQEEDFNSAVSEIATSLETVPEIIIENRNHNTNLSFSLAIDEKTNLEVSLKLTYPEQDGDSCYSIERFCEVSSTEWTGDTSLQLMDLNNQ